MHYAVNPEINASFLGHLFRPLLPTVYDEKLLSVNPAPAMQFYYFVLD
jgi:hypothetical protein